MWLYDWTKKSMGVGCRRANSFHYVSHPFFWMALFVEFYNRKKFIWATIGEIGFPARRLFHLIRSQFAKNIFSVLIILLMLHNETLISFIPSYLLSSYLILSSSTNFFSISFPPKEKKKYKKKRKTP